MDMVITRSYYGGPWRCHCSPGLGPVLCDWCEHQEQQKREQQTLAPKREQQAQQTAAAPYNYVSTRRDRRGEAW